MRAVAKDAHVALSVDHDREPCKTANAVCGVDSCGTCDRQTDRQTVN